MFKAFFGSTAVFALLVFSMVAPAGVLQAQQGDAVQEGVPVQAGVPVGEGAPVGGGVPVGEGVPAGGGVPVQADAAPGEGVAVKAAPEEVVRAEAGPKELTDEEIRQLLSAESLERFGHWKKRRGFRGPRACSDYDGVHGPTRPNYVYCSPDDVSTDQIELYRERLRQENSTFINEPAVKF